ncbi:ATP-binding protein [Rubrivivax rivuli]|uniref:histidine kinase n=1 Tax=Rubrivivax rivuli TaxID=1862385 RepID=A0A437RER8_9BURK|nr:ATP-binding protein [Rubrivivax rivuli]RVU45260.1 PAS domain-containing hybrid sensor histidine kinase/response regulator [Rubrivivax rivuli]
MTSLRTRFVVTTLLVFVAVLAAGLLAARVVMHDALRDEVARGTERRTALLTAALTPMLLQRDLAAAEDLLQGLVREGSLRYVEVRDVDGGLFAQAGRAPSVPPPPTPASEALRQNLQAVDGVFHFEGQLAMEGRTRGTFRFGVSDQALRQAEQLVTVNLLIIGATGAVAAALLQLLLGTLLTRRLAALSAAADRLAVSDGEVSFDVSGDDEVARLAQSFDRMSQALRQRVAALHDAELRQRTLVGALAEGVVFQDDGDRVLECNDAACRLLGLSREQLLGVDSMDPRWRATDPEGRPFDFTEHPSVVALRTGQPVFDVQMGVHRPDGSRVWLSINSQPLLASGAGRAYATVTSFSDITARVEAERILQLNNEDLERRVAERTAELATARDLAESANRAKTEFLSRMSHELRTPLNAILGFAQVLRLRERAAPQGVDEQLGHIESAGWHLLDLINDVLDLSRIEAGTLVVSMDAVAVAPVLGECLRMVDAEARRLQLSLHVDPLPPALAVRGDATRLRQVLVNLLSNACKYNRPGGRVHVRVAADEVSVQLSVVDSGVGLNEQQRASLFQPFNRLGAESSAVEGTGIGLVITQRLMALMGGTLDVDSEPGVGTTFTVRLARASLSQPPAPNAAPAAGGDVAARWTLLYVEDNRANQELLAEVLRLRPSVRLLCAADGEEGLASAAAQRPDLVVVDIALPGIDGYALCRRLRALPALRQQPIVALTANALPRDRARGVEAGFDRYFTKPLDVPQFLAWLDTVLLTLPR